MADYRHVLLALATALTMAGCGSGGGADTPEIVSLRINDLMKNVGMAVADGNWPMLASLHVSDRGIRADELATQFTEPLHAAGTVLQVATTRDLGGDPAVFQQWLDGGEVAGPLDRIRGKGAVVIGSGADPGAAGFRGMAIQAFIGEENGQFLILRLAPPEILGSAP